MRAEAAFLEAHHLAPNVPSYVLSAANMALKRGSSNVQATLELSPCAQQLHNPRAVLKLSHFLAESPFQAAFRSEPVLSASPTSPCK